MNAFSRGKVKNKEIFHSPRPAATPAGLKNSRDRGGQRAKCHLVATFLTNLSEIDVITEKHTYLARIYHADTVNPSSFLAHLLRKPLQGLFFLGLLQKRNPWNPLTFSTYLFPCQITMGNYFLKEKNVSPGLTPSQSQKRSTKVSDSLEKELHSVNGASLLLWRMRNVIFW